MLAAHSTHFACAQGKALAQGRLCASQLLPRRGRGGEFLKTRIVPQRIEHRIEPEQGRGKSQRNYESAAAEGAASLARAMVLSAKSYLIRG